MKYTRWVGLFVFLLAYPAVVQAATDPRFQKGTWELAVSFNSITGSLSPLIGYFIDDNLEGILHFDYSHTDLSGSGLSVTTNAVGGGGALYYNVQTGTRVVLFFGPDFVFLHSDVNGTTTDTVTFTGDVGIRLLVGQQASIILAGIVGYAAASTDSGGSTSTVSGLVAGVKIIYSLFFF